MIYIARRVFENEMDRSNEAMNTEFMYSEGNWVDITDLAKSFDSYTSAEEVIMNLNNQFKDYYAFYYVLEVRE